MIAFGSSITAPEIYERCAERGFRTAAEGGSKLFAQPAAGSIFRSYNLILEQAMLHHDLEALVLVHQDVEIVDPGFCQKIRRVLSDPDVGVVGCVGAIGVRSIAWWEGAVTWASFVHRYEEFGGGEFPSLTWDPDELPPYACKGEADTVDGLLMVLSPWTVRNIRFDESLGLPLHGYDFDLCLEVRAAGRKVMTEDLRVVHHHSLLLVDDPEPYVEAHMKLAEKWDGRMPDVAKAPRDWKLRARRAEAEATTTRAEARAWQIQIDAHARRHEQMLREVTDSTSMKVTAPLRRLNALRRGRRR
jgi:GT2 family glycosyltransferase